MVVSDSYNHRLKLVDPRKKAVVTLAGTGTLHALLGVVRVVCVVCVVQCALRPRR